MRELIPRRVQYIRVPVSWVEFTERLADTTGETKEAIYRRAIRAGLMVVARQEDLGREVGRYLAHAGGDIQKNPGPSLAHGKKTRRNRPGGPD